METSKFFYALRGLAIISVAYAHSFGQGFTDAVYGRIGSMIGLLGVPLFLFCSGYFFRHTQWNPFWKKLTVCIICPWLIWGTLSYISSIVLGGAEISVIPYLSFLAGHKTWFYYLSVYLMIRCAFNWGRWVEKDMWLYVAIAIWLVSSALTFLLPVMVKDVSEYITPYQNPLNWVGYYALGILFRRHDSVSWIRRLPMGTSVWIPVLFTAITVVVATGSFKLGYWNPAIVAQSILLIIMTPLMYGWYRCKVLVIIGRYSLLIYLLHMQFALPLATFFYKRMLLPQWIVLTTKPLLVVGISMFLIYVLTYCVRILGLREYGKALGLPESEH